MPQKEVSLSRLQLLGGATPLSALGDPNKRSGLTTRHSFSLSGDPRVTVAGFGGQGASRKDGAATTTHPGKDGPNF